MRRKFKICEACGAHLDHGEVCDCKKERSRDTNEKERNEKRRPGRGVPYPAYGGVRG